MSVDDLKNDIEESGLTRLYGGENRCDAGELLVEVAGIGWVADGRKEWRSDPLVVDIVPIDVSEEGMRHDLLGIGWTGAKAKFRFTGE